MTEVFALVRQGLATKRIGAALGISPRTGDKHVQRTLDKLGVRTRIQAVALLEQTPGSTSRPPSARST